MRSLIPLNGVSPFAAWYGRARRMRDRCNQGSKSTRGNADVEGWFVRDRDGFGVGPWGRDRGHAGQGRRAHRGQLFHQQEGGRGRPPTSAARPARRWSWCRAMSPRDEDCRKIVAAAAPWGRLDALVNNAGTTKHVAHDNLDGLSAEDFQRIYAASTPSGLPDGPRRARAAGGRREGVGTARRRSSTCRRLPASAASAPRSPMPRARARSTP